MGEERFGVCCHSRVRPVNEAGLNLRERVLAAVDSVSGAVVLRDGRSWPLDHRPYRDLDVWCPTSKIDELAWAFAAVDVRLADRTDHTARFAGADVTGVAVVDVAVGAVCAGMFTPVSEQDVIVDGGQLTGAAFVCDALWRKMATGSLPSDAVVEQARDVWRLVDVEAKQRSLAAFPEPLRTELSDATALGHRRRLLSLARKLHKHHRRRSIARLRQQGRLFAATRLLASRALFSRRNSRGVLVAVVGVDGSGKSTLVQEATGRLNDAGILAMTVYCGSVRENAKLIAMLRRLASSPTTPSGAGASDAVKPVRLSLMRRVSLILLAVDGVWRHWTRVAPLLRAGITVVCDRWVADLRLEPQPGWPALARWTERLVGRPQVAVLADPPVDVIAARSLESPLWRASRYQATYSVWLDRQTWARRVRADTSGVDPAPAAAVVAAVVAAHCAPVDPAHT